MGEREKIGHVDVKGGVLAILDFGMLGAFEDLGAARDAIVAASRERSNEVEHDGVELVVIGGIPNGRYDVTSEASAGEEFEGSRRSVTIELAPGQKSVKRKEIGTVPVDNARLGLFDAGSLPSWNESDPSDGKADIVFWGGDEDEVAKRVDAPKLNDEEFGWTNLPVADAVKIGRKLEALRNEGELRFAFDFRPHTHPFHLLAQIRANESEAGTIEIGDCAVCGFMTTWGDGVFPVFLETDDRDVPLRIEILFETEDAIENMRAVNEDEDDEDDEDDDDLDDEDDDDEDDDDEDEEDDAEA